MIYLNENWKETWGGFLELWSKDVKKCEKKIGPLYETPQQHLVGVRRTFLDFKFQGDGFPSSLNEFGPNRI